MDYKKWNEWRYNALVENDEKKEVVDDDHIILKESFYHLNSEAYSAPLDCLCTGYCRLQN